MAKRMHEKLIGDKDYIENNVILDWNRNEHKLEVIVTCDAGACIYEILGMLQDVIDEDEARDIISDALD